ncbi:hypothetical protein PU629_06385 [Pullulanibacillus sp. KACC 23026]|uniref:hypothetical protein n=1 Tax=Pullulanibacillus sp. KACC 23026 TaxID=3028315 RepID=UPI0023AF6E00|nr:hypothetical protein [Pullulanibacillus sp. KACC 23026]WEG13992.1 hypothetical protein PU629_06385 [Pullulanibacillus sp. KACC 23026]
MPRYSFKCMDCESYILSNSHSDGVHCPGCGGPIVPVPYAELNFKKKYKSLFACTSCNHSETLTSDNKAELTGEKECPKCKGKFVDRWYLGKHELNMIDPMKHDLVITCDSSHKIAVWKDGKMLTGVTSILFDAALNVKAPELKITQFILGDEVNA